MSARFIHVIAVRTALALAAAMLSATAFAQEVNYDFDRSTDFSKYKTFAYKVCMNIDNPLVDKRIVAGLENVLALEGLTKADGDAA